MNTDYVRSTEAPFYERADDRKPIRRLLWGDRVVRRDDGPPADGRVPVRARGRNGFVAASDLGGEALLDVYFIDVGQGDGVLLAMPDGRHLLIDGGFKRRSQPTGKNAADFVDWKFTRDLGMPGIELDAMISTHNDADHYGGLWDLINPGQRAELNATFVKVKRFFTAGVCWFKAPGTDRFLGTESHHDGHRYLTDLLSSRDDAAKWLASNATQKLQGEWGEFIRTVLDHGCPVHRLSHLTQWIPGFSPTSGDGPRIRVLGPVEFSVDGRPALRSLGNHSQNTNGNSLLLRVDYGRTRILLTGDLNAASQAILLRDHPDGPGEFAADVVKACHHGSDDCSLEFLRAIQPGATVISSGDAEGHSHPRPRIVAASGLTGHVQVDQDRLVTPLVYSTEISRSYRLGRIDALVNASGTALPDADHLRARYRETDPGALNPRTRERKLIGSHLVSGLIYGLVNVRTDGRRILCATMNENTRDWDIQSFSSRF